MKIRLHVRAWIAGIITIILLLGSVCTVFAANATVSIDADTASVKEKTVIGIEISADAQPDTYYVELAYDAKCLKYVKGADQEPEEGMLILQGTATEQKIHYDLTFECISGGASGLYVIEASLIDRSDDTLMTIVYNPSAHIEITGDATEDNTEFLTAMEKVEASHVEYSIQGIFNTEDKRQLAILDPSGEVLLEVENTFKTITDKWGDEDVLFLTDHTGKLRLVYVLEDDNAVLYALGQDDVLYPCQENEDIYYVNPKAVLYWPEGLNEQIVESNGIIFAVSKFSEASGFYKLNSNGDLIAWEKEIAHNQGTSSRSISHAMLAGIFAVVVVLVIISIVLIRRKNRKSPQPEIAEPQSLRDDYDLDQEAEQETEKFSSLRENLLMQMEAIQEKEKIQEETVQKEAEEDMLAHEQRIRAEIEAEIKAEIEQEMQEEQEEIISVFAQDDYSRNEEYQEFLEQLKKELKESFEQDGKNEENS